MSTDTDILHLKTQFEHLKDNLAKGGKPASFQQGRSKIRKQAKEKGIDPDLVAPLDKKAEKKIEVKLETVGLSVSLRTIKPIPVAEICVEPEIQQRASHVDLALRAEYAEAMKAGATFPPVVVFDADMLWLADGFHRVGAAEDAGLTEILADIREGDERDALLYAVGANAEHGARRTAQDKHRAVATLLRDPEWKDRSDRWIAETAKVSHPFVAKVRESLTVKPTGNVSSDLDEASEPKPPPAPPASAPRQGRDGRTTNTSSIGKKSTTKSTPASTTKPKGPNAVEAQQAMHRFGGMCKELRAVEPALVEHEIFRICELTRDTLIHFLPSLNAKDRTAMVERVSAAAGEA
jgi:hypothetical protein